MTKEDAVKFLTEEQTKNQKECAEAINGILEKYQCTLVGQPIITHDGRISVTVDIRSTSNGN